MALPPPIMAADLLFANAQEKKLYWDRSHYDSPGSQMSALAKSKTLYVGNLAFSTRSSHIMTHFGFVGPVKVVQMGLDRCRKTPCGFCFVEYVHRKDALLAVAYLSGTKLDGRIIRVELDAGFQPGRQYGRGQSGGQVRDERRQTVDPARSGRLKWTPPQRLSSGTEASHYGPATTSAVKREREDDGDNTMDQPLKSQRYRESDDN